MEPLDELVPRWRAALLARGRRPRGVARYVDQVTKLIAYLGPHPTPISLTAERIEDYVAACVERGWKPSTRLNALTATRSFCRYLVKRGLLDADPTAPLDWPQRQKRAPRPLSHAELRRLWAILSDEPKTPGARRQHARNKLAIGLMYYCGLRIAEAAALRWEHIDLDAGVLTVYEGKGGKDRSVPLHADFVGELRVAAAVSGGSGPVLRGAKGQALGHKSLGHVFERWLPKRGLKISAHRLRHTFATEVLRAGADLSEVQELLGHASPETTRIYTLVAPERLRGAVDRLPSRW